MTDFRTEQKLVSRGLFTAVDLLNPQMAHVLKERSKEFSPDYTKVLGVHFKFYGTDGVSLEGQKMKGVLEENGFNVKWCSGDVPDEDVKTNKGKKIDGLDYQSKEMERLRARIFAKEIDPNTAVKDEQEILGEMFEKSLLIQEKVENYINENNIGVVHVRNLFSLPLDMPATLAMYRIMMRRPELLFVMHHHDFVWEGREDKYTTLFPEIKRLLDSLYPPKVTGPTRKHVVISTIAQRELADRYGIEAVVLPDSFDYTMPYPDKNSHKKQELWRDLGIGENDLVVGVMTRVIPRKGIELAIQMAAELKRQIKDTKFQKKLNENGQEIAIHNGKLTKDSDVVLLVVQKEDLKDNVDYYKALQEYAREFGVKMVFAGHRVAAQEGYTQSNKIIYPFYEMYSFVNAVIFPSKREGFGNQLLEIIWGKIIPVVFEYPVFKTDIRHILKNRFISLGDTSSLTEVVKRGLPLSRADEGIVRKASRKLLNVLTNPDLYDKQTRANIATARQHFDISKVGERFKALLGEMREAAFSERLQRFEKEYIGERETLTSLASGEI